MTAQPFTSLYLLSINVYYVKYYNKHNTINDNTTTTTTTTLKTTNHNIKITTTSHLQSYVNPHVLICPWIFLNDNMRTNSSRAIYLVQMKMTLQICVLDYISSITQS